jgi:uroporphyrinogen-III synthase
VRARGAKAVGVLAGEDVPVAWRAPAETMDEVLDALRAAGLRGRRIGVQLHGGDCSDLLAALAAEGAEVVAVPVHRTGPAPTTRAAERLATSAARGELDAITFTSAAAVAALAAVEGLVDDLHRGAVTCACVGPVTAAAARDAGLPDVVTAAPARLGSMLRTLGERLAERGRTLEVAGVELRHQGSHLAVDGAEVRLTPRERRLLEVMLATEGAVLSKERLASTAWDAPVDEHTVEVAINRLRRKLGPAALALETTNRRGYRIAI